MAKITHIAIHHFGGLATNPSAPTSQHTLEDINRTHKARWPDFPSKLRPDLYIGYNAIIFPDGSMVQTRYLGEETAAVKGWNKTAVSFCLAGNFNKGVENPTWSQRQKLGTVLKALLMGKPELVGLEILKYTILDLTANNIVPHRILQPGTDCYGTSLEDNWARNLVSDNNTPQQIDLLRKLANLYQQLLQLLKRKGLGVVSEACSELDLTN